MIKDALSYVPGDVVAGRYRITGVLGRGGFGAVYAGEHLGTEQPVAVKMMSASADDQDAVERFFREARITAKLTHPNTVRVFDVGRDGDGPLYMVMEMLRGPTLEQLLHGLVERGRPMSEAESIEIATSILKSLAEAHAAGLVHRDLKPANIMLHRVQGVPDQVKVLDFGCSHTVDSNLTSEGTVMGTPGYMSPEQCLGEAVDPRSDLYALGVVLFRCVTLRLPFTDQAALTLLYKHAHVDAPDAASVAQQPISPQFSALLARALAKNPADRFADATAMRRALEDHRDSQVAQVTQLGPGLGGQAARLEAGVLLGRILHAAAAPLQGPSTSGYAVQPAADPPTVLESLPLQPVVAPAVATPKVVSPPQSGQIAASAPAVAVLVPAQSSRLVWLAAASAVVIAVVLAALLTASPPLPELAAPMAVHATPALAPPPTAPSLGSPPEQIIEKPVALGQPVLQLPAAATTALVPAPAEKPPGAEAAAKGRPTRPRPAPAAGEEPTVRPRVQPRLIND